MAKDKEIKQNIIPDLNSFIDPTDTTPVKSRRLFLLL